jgi:hypothetical protein
MTSLFLLVNIERITRGIKRKKKLGKYSLINSIANIDKSILPMKLTMKNNSG